MHPVWACTMSEDSWEYTKEFKIFVDKALYVLPLISIIFILRTVTIFFKEKKGKRKKMIKNISFALFVFILFLIAYSYWSAINNAAFVCGI